MLREYQSNKGAMCKEDGCTETSVSKQWCKLHYMRFYQRANPKKMREKRKKYRDSLEGKTTTQKYRIKNRDKLKEKQWVRNLRVSYGISPEEYWQMLLAQGGVCAICHSLPLANKRLGVDHCHKTGRVRGLLCHLCNVAVGFLEKDSERTTRGFAYIKRYQ